VRLGFCIRVAARFFHRLPSECLPPSRPFGRPVFVSEASGILGASSSSLPPTGSMRSSTDGVYSAA
jgi:hypothetical protein